jgi:hypothetical protein
MPFVRQYVEMNGIVAAPAPASTTSRSPTLAPTTQVAVDLVPNSALALVREKRPEKEKKTSEVGLHVRRVIRTLASAEEPDSELLLGCAKEASYATDYY